MSTLPTLTTIPNSFGSGGANLAPGGAAGSPTLAAVLQEHKDALETLDSATIDLSDLASADHGKGASLVAVEDADDHFTSEDVEAVLAEMFVGFTGFISDLASTDNEKGASLVGVEDSGDLLTAETVEAALAEIATGVGTLISDLASTDNAKGASLIGIEDAGIQFTATTVEGALAEVKTLADAGMTVQKKTVTKGFADLTGATTSFDIGTVLPANAIPVAAFLTIGTPFSGGSLSAIKANVGIKSGDVDAIIAAADIFTGATSPTSSPVGVSPVGRYGGSTLQLQITGLVGDTYGNVTAGAVTAEVLYVVLA